MTGNRPIDNETLVELTYIPTLARAITDKTYHFDGAVADKGATSAIVTTANTRTGRVG